VTTGREIIQRMLQRAVMTGDVDQGGHDDTSDYDWSRPHSFSEAELLAARDLLARSAGELSRALGRIVRDEVTVEVTELKEVYAADLMAGAAGEAKYYIALNTGDDAPCGYLVAESANAAEWVAKLLGGSTGAASREMSALEQSLLGDVMASLASAIIGPVGAAGGAEIVPGNTITRETVPLGEGSGEYVEMSFVRPDLDKQVVVTTAIRSDVILPAVGGGGGRHVVRTPAENRRAMIEQLSRVSVDIVGHLGRTELSIRDASTIGVGDVLVLDLAVGQEVEIYLQQTKIAMGMPVRDGEHKAVQITEMIQAPAKGADGAEAGVSD